MPASGASSHSLGRLYRALGCEEVAGRDDGHRHGRLAAATRSDRGDGGTPGGVSRCYGYLLGQEVPKQLAVAIRLDVLLDLLTEPLAKLLALLSRAQRDPPNNDLATRVLFPVPGRPPCSALSKRACRFLQGAVATTPVAAGPSARRLPRFVSNGCGCGHSRPWRAGASQVRMFDTLAVSRQHTAGGVARDQAEVEVAQLRSYGRVDVQLAWEARGPQVQRRLTVRRARTGGPSLERSRPA